MKKLSIVLAFLLICLIVNAQEILPQDSTIKVGKLSNGLTYYIKHNEKPENQACFYIAQKVGSMQEEDNQRGLAHFLEHMAFNGTENFPGKRIIDMLQENGVNFGGELNAYTSFDETVYNIDKVPTNKNSWLLDSCLIILSDWSHRLTLSNQEIDNERGVIHSEWRMRTGANYRMLERSMPKLYPNSKYAFRMPIGIMDIVDNFPYQDLKDYYKTWYYPHHQGIIVVGDIDVNEMEKKIEKYFSAFETPTNAPKKQLYPVPDNDTPIFVSEKDKEQTYNIVALMFKMDATEDKDKTNISYFVAQTVKNLISTMADNRFNELMQNPDAPFAQAGAGIDNYLVSKTKDAFEFQAVAKEGQEFESLKTLAKEALRIKKYGFTNSELERTKTELINSLERSFNDAANQDNSHYISLCLRNFLDNEPLMSIAQKYALTQQILPSINIEIINQVAQNIYSFDGKNMVCLAMLAEKDGATYISESEMQKAVNQAIEEDVESYIDNVKNEPLISQKIKGGKIIKHEIPNDSFDTKIFYLKNGAKIVYKKTDFKNDEILFEAVKFGGSSRLNVNAQNKANVSLCAKMINSSGLGNFTLNELSKQLSGVNCNVSPYIQNLTQGFTGYSSKKDLETMFQMLYLYFTNVNQDNNDYKSFMSQIEMSLKNRNANPESVFSDTLVNALYDNNIRTKQLSTEDLKFANQNQMNEIYNTMFDDPSSFTYFFVGAINEQELENLAQKYLGGFKKKNSVNTYIKGVQEMHKGKKDVTFSQKMETPQSMIYDYLYQETTFNTKNKIVAQTAAKVLNELFFNEIREEKSIAYSAGAYSNFSQSENTGMAQDMIIFYSPVKPEHATEAQEVMYRILKDVSLNGFDIVLMDKAKEYFLKHYQEMQKDNHYWLGTITNKILYNTDLHSDYISTVKNISKEDVMNYCKNILNNYNQVNVIMLPK